jgi:hypothetical protein
MKNGVMKFECNLGKGQLAFYPGFISFSLIHEGTEKSFFMEKFATLTEIGMFLHNLGAINVALR